MLNRARSEYHRPFKFMSLQKVGVQVVESALLDEAQLLGKQLLDHTGLFRLNSAAQHTEQTWNRCVFDDLVVARFACEGDGVFHEADLVDEAQAQGLGSRNNASVTDLSISIKNLFKGQFPPLGDDFGKLKKAMTLVP